MNILQGATRVLDMLYISYKVQGRDVALKEGYSIKTSTWDIIIKGKQFLRFKSYLFGLTLIPEVLPAVS